MLQYIADIRIACHFVCTCRDLVLSVYDELSSQDTEALSQVDDGADIVGMNQHIDDYVQGCANKRGNPISLQIF